MAVSFIITTFNIETYVRQCLASVAACVRPGDQVVIVDDGSTDDTVETITALLPDLEAKGVEVTTAFLGVNTFGGVGIGGNIGMDLSTRDIVFFVDGDDYLDPAGFEVALREFEASDADISLANYREWDEIRQEQKSPADHHKWASIGARLDAEGARVRALDMIAVPWRKFYRRDLLVKHKLRFPEGDFFFEDNPFHWDVCRAASRIHFTNRVICYHRVNRPGQTMTSKGYELQAFFVHFQSIFASIAPQDDVLREMACRWLINNMTWHLERMHVEALWAYFQTGHTALRDIPDDLWNGAVAEYFLAKSIWPTVCMIREGNAWSVLESIKAKRRHDEMRALVKKGVDEIAVVRAELRKVAGDTKASRQILQAQRYMDEFRALISDDTLLPRKFTE
ncbi:glycosyltransferase family 2 protein [Falsirhodobacter algicola]|uniref:Glycosyltransferase n=1 Tax=Falsirhodobacter algicola TaxID=2692330 RepID=A0A8J8MSZ9_9RHOB|nr:glycosyltransferase [Falsirhodobacter algicola]QUS35703.1 glycosyltransferase [Falsirhodobacter algicola]